MSRESGEIDVAGARVGAILTGIENATLIATDTAGSFHASLSNDRASIVAGIASTGIGAAIGRIANETASPGA